MSDDQQTGFAGLEPMEGGWSGRTFLAEAGGERTVVRVYDPDDRDGPTRDAAVLAGVEMSTERTHDDTLAALRARGLDVGSAPVERDVDTVADADVVAAACPSSRFARAWLGVDA